MPWSKVWQLLVLERKSFLIQTWLQIHVPVKKCKEKWKLSKEGQKLTLTGRKLVSPVYLDRFCVT